MENVELSKEDVEKVVHQEKVETLEADRSAKAPKSKKMFADIVSRQSPHDFEVQKEPTTEQEASEADQSKAEKAEKPDDKKVKDESLAQENGEEDAQKAESEPLLPDFLSERISKEFPDEKIETPEQAQALLDRVFTDAKALEAEREAVNDVYELFENSDEMVNVAREMKDGRSFLEAVALTVNIEETLADLKETDPEQYKKVVRAQVEREKAAEEREKSQKELEQQFEKNGEASEKAITDFKKANELDPDASKQFLDALNKHFDDMVAGRVTPDYLDIMHKGMNYDADLEAAKEQGRVEGRNARIEIEKTKKQGDNLPRIPTGTNKDDGEKSTASRGKRALAILAANSQSDF